jgi:hypothetical protein
MATKYTGNWSELFDVALFETDKAKLRQRIDHARHAISHRIDALVKGQNESGGSMPEQIVLRDALTTLSQLNDIAYARKPSASVNRAGGTTAEGRVASRMLHS